MKLYNRKNGKMMTELEYGQKKLEFLYHTFWGRVLLKIVSMPFVSNLSRIYKKSSFSKKSIEAFVKKYSVEVAEDELSRFKSFNDFFIRKRKVSFCNDPKALTAIADSKLSFYNISPTLRLNIKNSSYSIEEILDDDYLAKRFANGCCLIFRLAVDDIHHYFYFDDGKVISQKKIEGQLHTIRPISEKYNVFSRNKREVTVLDTKNFGVAVQIEVGALLVGRIVNAQISEFKRGTEKGYFEFGGSTIILLLEKTPQMDEDIIKANSEGIETCVIAGERIGRMC